MLTLITAFCLFKTPDIKATIQSYVQAVANFDVARLEKLLDKDYLEVSPLGEVDERDKVLSFYRIPADQRGPTPSGVVLDDWQIRPLGENAAIAVYREDLQVAGRKMSFRFTTVLRGSGSNWKLVSNHVNGIRSKT